MLNSNNKDLHQKGISRRTIIKAGIIAAAATFIPCKAIAIVESFLTTDERKLSFYNLHSKEYLQSTYWKYGEYIPDAMAEINYILRDHYCGAVRVIDKKLINLLFAIKQTLEIREPFHIISGYRTPQTNSYLRKNNKGVAKKSLHIYGKAVDLRLPGHKLKDLRRAAYRLQAGGVGYYPRSNFVHLDVGRPRYW